MPRQRRADARLLAPVMKTFTRDRGSAARRAPRRSAILGRSARALAISALIAAGIAACEPTLSEAVMNLPSTMTIGTDCTLYACASCFAWFILPSIANELYMSSTFLRSSPLRAAQSKNVLSFHSGIAAAVDRGEHLGRELVVDAERLERVVHLAEVDPAVLEHHRHAAELRRRPAASSATPAAPARGRRNAGSRRRRTRCTSIFLPVSTGCGFLSRT